MIKSPPGFEQKRMLPADQLVWHRAKAADWDEGRKERPVAITVDRVAPTPRTGRAAKRWEKMKMRRATRKLMKLHRHGREKSRG